MSPSGRIGSESDSVPLGTVDGPLPMERGGASTLPGRLRLLKRLASAGRSGAGFWRVYRWLVRDTIREFPLRVLAIVGLSFAGALFQWASALTLLIYVNERVSSPRGGLSLPVVGRADLSIGASDGTLIAWGATALALVGLAVLTGYGSQALGFDLARRYTRGAGRRILTAVHGAPHALAAAATDQDDLDSAQVLRNTLQRDMTRVLRVLFLVIRSVHWAARLLVAGALLILIDPLLTLVLVGLGLLFLIPLYGVNRGAASASLRQEAANRDASRYTASLAKLLLRNDHSRASAASLASQYEDSEAIDRRLGALSGMVLASYRSQYIVTGFGGLAAVTIVLAFALSGTDDVAGWSTALIYLAALIVASASLNAISVTVTGASRFFPQVRRYTRLMNAAAAPGSGEEQRATGALEAVPVPRAIGAGPKRFDGSAASLQLDGGRAIFVYHPEYLDRTTLTGFLERLFALGHDDAAALRRGVHLCGEFATVGADDPPDAFVDGVRHAVRGGASVVILGWRPFSRLDVRSREGLLASAEDALVLLVGDQMPGRQPEDVVATVVVDGQGVRGIADGDLHREWAQLLAGPDRRTAVDDESDLDV